MSPTRRDALRAGGRAGCSAAIQNRRRVRVAGAICGSRRAVTLLELLMAMTITSMLSVVLGGIVLAVQSARQHTEGLEEATQQADAAMSRIEYMVSQAGVYRVGTNPVTVGLAVVPRRWSYFDLPEILVVWSGGRTGGMAGAGLQTRLPRINELVLYAPDPADPRRLVEITHPGNSASIDFRASGFASTILTLVQSSNAQKTLLSDRIRRSALSGFAGFSSAEAANVRFEMTQSPSDAEIGSTASGTAAWINLPWAGGIVTGSSGLRQANVRIELQVEPRAHDAPGTAEKTIAIPFFGSESIRYVYEP